MQYVYLFLPALIANTVPPIFAKLFPNFLNFSVDFGLTFRNKRILGDHKTFRGFFFGVLLGQLSFLLVYKMIEIDVPFYYGIFASFFALLFDSIKSFFKRQFNRPPGKPWFPFDQLDWVVGYLIILNIFTDFNLTINLLHILAGLFLTMSFKIIGYFLKINETYI